MTGDFTLINRCKAIPKGADFSIVISDSSLEPEIHNGQTVYVSCRAELTERDIGVFYYDNRVYCRRWCEDYNGALILLSENEPLYLNRQQRRRCLCLGKIIL